MNRTRNLIVAVVALLAVAGGGAAIAGTQLTPERENQAVLNDAARQLGIEPRELGDALEQALKNRVDAAVREGRMTRTQGERLKARIDAGKMPLFGLGHRFGPHGHHHDRPHFGRPGKLDAAASYLGMTVAQLRSALEGGKTLAQVARDRDKSVDGLVDALVANAERKLTEAVEAGRLTEAEKREMLTGLRERITNLVNGRHPRPFGRRFGVERPAFF
jgi:hypothetical protein